MPPILFDTHVHLSGPEFESDRAEVLARAAAGGISRMMEIADASEDWPRVLALCRAYPDKLRCALGLHPYYADHCTEDLLSRLEAHARLPEVAAIGEIGLDYARNTIPPEVQKSTLTRLLDVCIRLDQPVVIHCRQAYPDLRALLQSAYPQPPTKHRYWGVIHCFSGTLEDALELTASGFALGADGPVTYPKNGALREAFRRIGPAATVLETDSPYLPPQSCRGRRNEPQALGEIALTLAGVWGLSQPETARVTTDNAQALFRL
jgi:TatD DNase family protein